MMIEATDDGATTLENSDRSTDTAARDAASGSPAMYTGIALTNSENLAAWLKRVESQLAKLRRHVEAGDGRLEELFEEAREKRERWLRERG